MPAWVWQYSGYVVALVCVPVLLRAWFGDPARGRLRCRRCWYDMSGGGAASATSPSVCPECAMCHTKPGQLTKTRRRKKLALGALLGLVFGGYGLWVVPRVQAVGASGVIPTTPMVLLAPWLPPAHANQVVVVAPGPLPSPGSVGMGVTRELEQRLGLMSPISARVADWWWAVWDGDGVDGTPIGFPTSDPLTWRFRYELIAGGRFTESQTRQLLTEIVEKRLAELELRAGVGQMGRWNPAPRRNADPIEFDRMPLPKAWCVEWVEIRDGPGAGAVVSLRGSGGFGSRSSSDDRAWTGDGAVYRVTLRGPGQTPGVRWRVTYDILRGADAEARFATPHGFGSMIAVPRTVTREPDGGL